MALSYKARRRWSLVLLLVWLPVYIAVAYVLMSMLMLRFEIHGVVLFFMFVFLGVAWALPFKSVFKGIGQADPDATPEE